MADALYLEVPKLLKNETLFCSNDQIDEFIRLARVTPQVDATSKQPTGSMMLTDKHMAFLDQLKAGQTYNVLWLNDEMKPFQDESGRYYTIPVDGAVLKKAMALVFTTGRDCADDKFKACRNNILHNSPTDAATAHEKLNDFTLLQYASSLGTGLVQYNRNSKALNVIKPETPASDNGYFDKLGKPTSAPSTDATKTPATGTTGALDLLKQVSEGDLKLFASLYNPSAKSEGFTGYGASLPRELSDEMKAKIAGRKSPVMGA